MGYKLCKYSDGIGALTDIREILANTAANPFPASYQSFSEVVGTDLNGAVIKAGLPRVTWHWDWLDRADYNALTAFVGRVFIETPDASGTFARYSAVMSIPTEPEPLTMRRCGPVDVLFTMLIRQS